MTSVSDLTTEISPAAQQPAFTLATMFDDVIDAERVLALLRKSRQPASTISVILREQVLRENDDLNPYRTVLSEVVAKSSLEAAGKWLRGLASLILPDRAAYLAAGPIGQILSTVRDTQQNAALGEGESHDSRSEITQLSQTFMLFGFPQDEARYMQQRIVVGAAFIAITTVDTSQLRRIHRSLLRKSMPVYIGLARTTPETFERASRLMATGATAGGTVVIADAASPLNHVQNTPSLQGTQRDYRGRLVRSRYGEIIGRIEDLLFQFSPDETGTDTQHGVLSDDRAVLRYVIVRTARKAGMIRKTIALPGERIRLENGELIAEVTHEELVSAPRYESGLSMSRQDEATIRRHFSAPFYWISPDSL